MLKCIFHRLALLGAALASTSAVAQTTTPAVKPPLPTVVLVHGAFAESSSWDHVVAKLLARNYPVVAVANPLRGVKSDSEYVAAVLTSIQGPIVLVGHSYGGAVITNAAIGNGNVKALVYVAGLAPDLGESGVLWSTRFPGSTLGPTLAPPVALPDGGKDLYIQRDKFRAQFAADVPEGPAALMFATQRPVTEAAFNEAAGTPAWKSDSILVHLRATRQKHPGCRARFHGPAGGSERNR